MLLNDVLRLGLPVVQITTQGGVEPTADEAVKPDERCSGHSITNATKVPGRIVIWSKLGEMLYDSGTYIKGESGMTIKIRGNNSAMRPLKPYKVKLQKSEDLLIRDEPHIFRDKNWILIKEWRNTLNTPIGVKVSELLDYCWTPAYKLVNLLMNGEYRGVYILMEQVSRNERCRINVDEQTGYIIERDIYWWVAQRSFETKMYNGFWQRYTFKYPDEDDVTDSQMEYIQQAVEEMEEAVYDPRGEYEKHLDVESHAKWLLGHDILGTEDGGGSNRFLSKYDDSPGALFRMETIWDFDTNFYHPDEWSSLHDSPHTYAHLLFKSENRSFSKAYVRSWQHISQSIEKRMNLFLDSLAAADSAAMNASRRLEATLYGGQYITLQQNIAEAKQWFARRRKWMDVHIAEIDTADIKLGIRPIHQSSAESLSNSQTLNRKAGNRTYYDLFGRRLSTAPAKGLYIEDGRKRMVK